MPAEATLAQLATGRPGHRSSFIYRTNGREWELVEMRTRVRPALKGHSRIARKLPKRLSRDEAASLLAQPSRRYPTGIRDRALMRVLASPVTNGQPSESCLSSTAPIEPGQAASAPGSAFNEPSSTNPAGGIAGQMYAGNGQTTSTPANGAAVSQYDVACFQVSQPH